MIGVGRVGRLRNLDRVRTRRRELVLQLPRKSFAVAALFTDLFLGGIEKGRAWDEALVPTADRDAENLPDRPRKLVRVHIGRAIQLGGDGRSARDGVLRRNRVR